MPASRAIKTLDFDAFLLHHGREQGDEVFSAFDALMRRSGSSSIMIISEIPERHLLLSGKLLVNIERRLEDTAKIDRTDMIDKRLELLSQMSLASAFRSLMESGRVEIVQCDHMGLHKASPMLDNILLNPDIGIKDRLIFFNVWFYLSDQITFQRSQSMAGVAFQQRLADPERPMVILAGGQHVYDIEVMQTVRIGNTVYAIEVSRLNDAELNFRDMKDRSAFYNAVRKSMESDGQVQGIRADELAEAVVLSTDALLRDIKDIAGTATPLWIASRMRDRLRAFVRDIHAIVPEQQWELKN